LLHLDGPSGMLHLLDLGKLLLCHQLLLLA
jgi:hypothetical protein